MSDGVNNAVPWLDPDNTVGTPRPSHPTYPTGTVADTDSLTVHLCASMRAQDFEIYTVLFDPTLRDDDRLTSTSILRACADNDNRFYLATNTAKLREAFKDIAEKLAKLSVVK